MSSRDKTTLAFGVAYTEMANINLLSTQVQQATYLVTENQAIVTAFSAKLDQFNAYLTQASNYRTEALTLLNSVKDMDSNIKSLANNVTLAGKQMKKAQTGITGVACDWSQLVNKLIFSTEIIEKFSQIINKQKLISPLIPDTLISLLSKATNDANKAIALTLVALQSAYAADTTSLEASSMTKLENIQAQALLNKVEHQGNSVNDIPTATMSACSLNVDSPGILALIQLAYAKAADAYDEALGNVDMVSKQLAAAQSVLDTANTQLSSYSAGLAAATAAAYSA